MRPAIQRLKHYPLPGASKGLRYKAGSPYADFYGWGPTPNPVNEKMATLTARDRVFDSLIMWSIR